MKTCYLDANLLIFLSNKKSSFHQQAVNIIEQLVEGKYQIFLSTLSLDEYFHNFLRFSLDSKEKTLKKLKAAYRELIQISNLYLINAPLELKKQFQALNFMSKHNLHARDAYHLFIMLENKVKFLATFDSDFDKVFETGKIKKFV